jgi:hypothetical protein
MHIETIKGPDQFPPRALVDHHGEEVFAAPNSFKLPVVFELGVS